MAILQTFNKPGGVRRISTPMHTTLLRSPHLTSSVYLRSPYKKVEHWESVFWSFFLVQMLHLPRFLPIEDEDCSSSLSCSQSAALLCVRLVRYVLQELALPVDVCYCWSDSLVALSCIRGDACRLLPDPEQYCIPGESRMEHLHPCRLSDMVARPILVTGDTSGLADVRRPKHIRKRG
ncbi:hypothetical protein T08_14527 [Trichinella sp. T8]|nr:hypothetical protein T08_14527 [Trichinella sp. T8]